MSKSTVLAITMLAIATLPAMAASIAPQTKPQETDCATAERVPGTNNWRATGHIEIRLFRRISDGPLRGLPDNYLIQIDPDRFPNAAAFGPDVVIENDAWCVGIGAAIQASECDREAGMERIAAISQASDFGRKRLESIRSSLRERLAQAAEFFAASCPTKP